MFYVLRSTKEERNNYKFCKAHRPLRVLVSLAEFLSVPNSPWQQAKTWVPNEGGKKWCHHGLGCKLISPQLLGIPFYLLYKILHTHLAKQVAKADSGT